MTPVLVHTGPGRFGVLAHAPNLITVLDVLDVGKYHIHAQPTNSTNQILGYKDAQHGLARNATQHIHDQHTRE